MNDSLLKRHITIYSEQLRSRRLWNIFIIIIFAVSFFISSSIIDFNISKIINEGHKIGAPKHLFSRIKDEDIDKVIIKMEDEKK